MKLAETTVGGARGSAPLAIETRAMVLRWVEQYGGDREAVARFMARTLRIGPLPACRALVGASVDAGAS